ncbi:putative RNA helicase [Helianthus annuus]|nr:putative RNA helicase [Helianthus annuus]KAJ0661102.1 putative RNA helicase [Helianthus annuus]KAJ0841676.1 putative RNA helicase [Helianthus annuus]KAJ0855205.1 putative RNA helicase [Helianthus annuus]
MKPDTYLVAVLPVSPICTLIYPFGLLSYHSILPIWSVQNFCNPLPSYLVYSEKVKTSSIYIQDSTNISDYALLMFGGNLIPSKNGDGIEMLDGYLQFSASKSVLGLIKIMRGEVDTLLKRKIEDPKLDVNVEGKGVVAALVELLHNQNVCY